MTETGDSLEGMVRAVAGLRAAVARNRTALASRREDFNRENAGLLAAAATAEADLLAAETALRGAAEAVYRATRNTHPAPGVQIKVARIVNYRMADALEWARASGLCLIPESVDEKALAQIARVTALEFVTILEEGRAQLAGDLEAALRLAAQVASLTPDLPDNAPSS